MTTSTFETMLIAKANGKYESMPLSYFTDKITWLYKWHKIDYATMCYYTELIEYILGNREELPIKESNR